MKPSNTTQPNVLQDEVAKKYAINPAFTNCKLSFPKENKHGVPASFAKDLTLAEVDRLFEAGAVNGVFTLIPAEEKKKDAGKPTPNATA